MYQMKFLSFDCATKTLAYCMTDVTFKGNETFDIQDVKNIDELSFKWIGGDVVDLIPNKKDTEIHTVTRIKALCCFLNEKIKIDDSYTILIEFQMGSNAKARFIATSIVAFFYKIPNIRMISPTLKNKYRLFTEGGIDSFLEGELLGKGKAVKEQTKANFTFAIKKFGFDVKVSKKLLEHISDAFMQTVGYIMNGSSDEKY